MGFLGALVEMAAHEIVDPRLSVVYGKWISAVSRGRFGGQKPVFPMTHFMPRVWTDWQE
jgi:hypothetical protein